MRHRPVRRVYGAPERQGREACTSSRRRPNGAKVTTIEGLADADGSMHPMQAAFKECHGLQCGFCTPGMVMSAIDLVHAIQTPTKQTIRAELEGNLCRCTGYQNIVMAVQQGAAAMSALKDDVLGQEDMGAT